MKNILSVLLLFVLLLSSCEEEKKDPNTLAFDKIVLSAKTLLYTDLPDSIQQLASDASVVQSVGTTPETIQKENGYYLQLIIDNQLLAAASDDNGTWKTEQLLDNGDLHTLYGKYKNKPLLLDGSGQPIPFTSKHDGFTLVKVIRNKTVDTSYWGPFNRVAGKLVLQCSNLDSAHTPVVALTHP